MNEQTTKTPSQSPGLLLPILFGFALSAVVLFSVNDTIKPLSFGILITTIILGLFTYRDWRYKLSLPLLPFVGLVGICGISVFYALAKKFALYEFLGVLLSFCVFMMILMFVDKPATIGCVLVVAISIVSFLSIDLISTHIFSDLFELFASGVTAQYGSLVGVEVGVRMNSVLINPNVYSGCAGIGVLLCLGLAMWTEKKKQKSFYLGMLMLNSIGFVLAFSMGGTATLVLAFFVLLGLEQKEKRVELFLLMVETLVLSILAAFPIFLTSFETWEKFNPIPLLCTVVAMVTLVFIHTKFGKKATKYFSTHEKETKIFVISIISALLVYGGLAVTLTTSLSLDAGDSVRRAIYPSAGTYTLEMDNADQVSVVITSQNREQTMMHTSTTLYRGSAKNATFTVADDSEVVYFTLSTSQSVQISSAALSDGTKIPLNYPLLPGFVSTRLQGLFANQNAIQRTVFFEDGMQLFSQNPVFGLGMGSFESSVLQVQSFYYETKYVHNHYIQLLLETGIIGCLLFVCTLLGGLYGLNKAHKSDVPMAAMSVALLLFMFSHAFVEVVWSTSYYIILAFGVFGLITLQLTDVCAHEKNPLNKLPVHLISGICMLVFTVMLGLNLQSAKMVEEASESEFMQQLVLVSQLDFFENQDYKTSYVYSAIGNTDPAVHAQAEVFIRDLAKVQSNTIPRYVAMYQISRDDIAGTTETLVNYVDYVASDCIAWDVSFAILFNALNDQNRDEILQSITLLYEKYDHWNKNNIGTLVLDPIIIQGFKDYLPEVMI